jgi:hypothetical protein
MVPVKSSSSDAKRAKTEVSTTSGSGPTTLDIAQVAALQEVDDQALEVV